MANAAVRPVAIAITIARPVAVSTAIESILPRLAILMGRLSREAVDTGVSEANFAAVPEQEPPAFALWCTDRVMLMPVLVSACCRTGIDRRGKQCCGQNGRRNALNFHFCEPFHLQLPIWNVDAAQMVTSGHSRLGRDANRLLLAAKGKLFGERGARGSSDLHFQCRSHLEKALADTEPSRTTI